MTNYVVFEFFLSSKHHSTILARFFLIQNVLFENMKKNDFLKKKPLKSLDYITRDLSLQAPDERTYFHDNPSAGSKRAAPSLVGVLAHVP